MVRQGSEGKKSKGMAPLSHLKSLLELPEFLLLSGMAGKTSLHCSNYSFPKPFFRKQGCYFCKNLKGNTCLRQSTRMEHFSANKRWMFGSWELTGVCNMLQQRGCLVGSTNSQISKERKRHACWNVFSLAETAWKGCYSADVAVILFRWSLACSQKMSVPSFSSFPLSQPWPNSSATTFLLPPAVLSPPSSSPLPSAFILLRSALPAVWKGKQMALACVFCTLQGCDMMGSFAATLPSHQEGQCC